MEEMILPVMGIAFGIWSILYVRRDAKRHKVNKEKREKNLKAFINKHKAGKHIKTI